MEERADEAASVCPPTGSVPARDPDVGEQATPPRNPVESEENLVNSSPFRGSYGREVAGIWVEPEGIHSFRTAPDDWITEYVNRGEQPRRNDKDSPRVLVRAVLVPYSGMATDLFSWIDLFKALVHDTNLFPGEKLGLLKNNLKGKAGDIVYGLGGRKNAYRVALQRLTGKCGRRDLLRAAHLQAIDKLDPGNGNPPLFKRYAERVRTHMFDLTQIGDGYSTDIIERVGIKLKFADRLAWNEGKRDRYEDRSLEQFGTWLCTRADAYINVYEEAAEQLSWQTQETSHQRHGKANQISSESRKSGQGRENFGSNKIERTLVCYKCKGPRR